MHAIKEMISIVAIVAVSTTTALSQENKDGSAEHQLSGWTGGIGVSYFKFDKKATE